MSNVVGMSYDILDRVVRAAIHVRIRMLRATSALNDAGIPYAVTGDCAVATWVARFDEDAVRNPVDVELLVREDDLGILRPVLESARFCHRTVNGKDVFIDGPMGKVYGGIHIVLAGKKIRDHHLLPAPMVDETLPNQHFELISLKALVRMKLNSFRDKDRTHLRDMLELEMIDASWKARFPEPLADRLQQLIDTPDG